MALMPRLWLVTGLLLALVEAGPAAAEALGTVAWLGAVVSGAGALAWARAPARRSLLWAYVIPLATWAYIEPLVTSVGVTHGKLLPAAAALAIAFSGSEAACGVVAAIYTLAGLAKVLGAGAGFVDPEYLGTLILERSFYVPTALSSVRLYLAESRPLLVALSVGTLVVELGGAFFVLPRFRRPLAVCNIAMHAGIAVAMGYVYVQWACVVAGLAALPILSPSRPNHTTGTPADG